MRKIILRNTKNIDYGNGWTAKQKVWDEGKHTEYFYQGKRVKRKAVTGRIAEQYAGYALIEKDLRTILLWLERANNFLSEVHLTSEAVIKDDEVIENDLVKALFVAIVSFYGRLFTSCDGRKAKLERKIISEQYLPIHDELMNYRHNFVAHAGISNAEQVEIVCARPSKNARSGFPRIFIELRQLDTVYQRDDRKTIRGLVLHLQEHVRNKMSKMHDKIHQEQVFGKD